MAATTRNIVAYEGDYEIVGDGSVSLSNNSSFLEVRMFDVGAGEAILIIFPSSTAWLIDGGSTNGKIKNQETGEMLAQYLNDENLILTRIIASHPHKDHVGAVEYMLGEQPKLGSKLRYYFTDDPPGKSATKEWIRNLNSKLDGNNVERIDLTGRNEMITLPKGHAFLFAGKGEKEYTSIFMHLRYNDATFIFTGDVGRFKYEYELLDTYNENYFRSDVLKITHHGSTSGTSGRFVRSVKPGIAIASTADDDGHELEQEVRNRLAYKNRCKIFETLRRGNITMQSEGKKVQRNGKVGVLYNVTTDK
ncbi:MAG: ComEC/Rec2 family competence protein [Nitrososphaerales archaeon]